MARPRKFYFVYNQGYAEPLVYEGREEPELRASQLRAFQFSASKSPSYQTRQEAEERIDWHNYENERGA